MSEFVIEWIGTGSGLNPELGNTSFLVRGGERNLLVDCGFTVPGELIKSHEMAAVIDVVVTHRHADHIGGLESLAFMNYYALGRRGSNGPNLYLATYDFARLLWSKSLSGGLGLLKGANGDSISASLGDFFNVHIGTTIQIPNLPQINLFETPHIPNSDNYGLRIEGGIYYSGDSTKFPPSDAKVIFQDCQFYTGPNGGRGDVHVSYDILKRQLPDDQKAKTYLVHLGRGWEKINPKADGFAGFVMPRDRFEF